MCFRNGPFHSTREYFGHRNNRHRMRTPLFSQSNFVSTKWRISKGIFARPNPTGKKMCAAARSEIVYFFKLHFVKSYNQNYIAKKISKELKTEKNLL